MNQKANKIFNQDVFKRDHIMLLNNKVNSEQKFMEIVQKEILQKADQILLDLLWKAYQFSLQMKFTVEQIATFLSITNFIFIESFQAKMVHLESYSLLKQILNNHTFQSPPFSIGIFTQDNVQNINKFMRNYFYRYFSLYETTQNVQCEYTIATQKQQEDWPVLQDLNEGTQVNPQTLKILQAFINQFQSQFSSSDPQINFEDDEQQINQEIAEQAIIKKVLETRETKENNKDKKLEESIEKFLTSNLNLEQTLNQRNNNLFDLVDEKKK